MIGEPMTGMPIIGTPIQAAFELRQERIIQVKDDPYLTMKLDGAMAAIAMDYAQEATIVPMERLTLMPNMPGHFLGLVNHRSRIFWAIDLASLFGFTPLEFNAETYQIVVLNCNDEPLGLAVRSVQGVRRFGVDRIRSAETTVRAELIPYLKGCVDDENGQILVLDAEALVGQSHH
jgi:positive phototaxis protein PixI